MSGHGEHEARLLLDRVDGLSDFGFGDDIDLDNLSDECSALSENSELTALPRRRVHFRSDVEHMNIHGKSTSPSLTRALLPSAQPLGGECHVYALNTQQLTWRSDASPVGNADHSDSDATEVSSRIPTPSQENVSETGAGSSGTVPTTITTPVRAKSAEPAHKRKTRSSRRRRGPPRGMFTVDQDKSWAILDSTGKKILQIPAASTNRHAWLDEMSQSTPTPSVSASPLESSLNVNQRNAPASIRPAPNGGLRLDTALPHVMGADLTGQNSLSANDHSHSNPPEAFFSSELRLVGGDYAVSPEADSDAYEDATPASKKARFSLGEFLEDFEEDDFEEADSALPLFAPADDNLTADNDGLYGHLNNINVTAFRRSADPMSASRPGTAESFDLQASPIAGSSFEMKSMSAGVSRVSHKRKTSTTPYQDEKIYGNVTPVERKVLGVPKRRKIST